MDRRLGFAGAARMTIFGSCVNFAQRRAVIRPPWRNHPAIFADAELLTHLRAGRKH
jgi:hypothetical protein